MERDNNKQGVDIAKYLEEVEKELFETGNKSVTEYISEREEFGRLYKELRECDQTLGSMEKILGSFQTDLNNIWRVFEKLQIEAKDKDHHGKGLKVRAAPTCIRLPVRMYKKSCHNSWIQSLSLQISQKHWKLAK